jgi:uncharacterized protein YodC (DUF2158 family)
MEFSKVLRINDFLKRVSRERGAPMRKLKFRTTLVVTPVAEVEAKFSLGDIVHALDGGEVGIVSFVHRDGQINVVWPSGEREWICQERLCPTPLTPPWPGHGC